MKNKSCKSCLMPFDKDPGTREHEDYCSYCYKDGKLCFEGSFDDFKKVVYESMTSRGMNTFKARFFTWMIQFAPRWKNKN